MSTIVTFYSYKGGVGRSMALANVAWLLSTKYGKKVLVVDWDLEAPGLHRFFGIASKDIKVGLIDLFEEYKALLKEVKGSLPTKLVDLKQCFVDVPLSDGVAEFRGSMVLKDKGSAKVPEKRGSDYVAIFVRQLGGTIVPSESEGPGTIVRIRLPLLLVPPGGAYVLIVALSDWCSTTTSWRNLNGR